MRCESTTVAARQSTSRPDLGGPNVDRRVQGGPTRLSRSRQHCGRPRRLALKAHGCSGFHVRRHVQELARFGNAMLVCGPTPAPASCLCGGTQSSRAKTSQGRRSWPDVRWLQRAPLTVHSQSCGGLGAIASSTYLRTGGQDTDSDPSWRAEAVPRKGSTPMDPLRSRREASPPTAPRTGPEPAQRIDFLPSCSLPRRVRRP